MAIKAQRYNIKPKFWLIALVVMIMSGLISTLASLAKYGGQGSVIYSLLYLFTSLNLDLGAVFVSFQGYLSVLFIALTLPVLLIPLFDFFYVLFPVLASSGAAVLVMLVVVVSISSSATFQARVVTCLKLCNSFDRLAFFTSSFTLWLKVVLLFIVRANAVALFALRLFTISLVVTEIIKAFRGLALCTHFCFHSCLLTGNYSISGRINQKLEGLGL